MPITFFKTKWEAGDLSLADFFQRCADDGFDGVELGLWNGSVEDIRGLCQKHSFRLSGHVITSGAGVKEHVAGLEKQFQDLVEAGADQINCHLGSDFFSFEDNCALFEKAVQLSRNSGVPVMQETHRGRPLYNLPAIFRYLEVVPGLKLTADISHLMCVHESNLENRWDLLEKMVPACRHVHARVGFEEGPQVAHPLAPEWSALRGIYLKFWKMILKEREGNLTVTPEAGPPGYMPVLPFSNMPVADAWLVNVAVKNWLKEELV